MDNLIQRFEVKANSEDGTFTAHGNVFGVIDSANDITYKGTFSRTIAEHKANGSMPKLLAQHGHTTMPIGIITDMKEDDTGLWFSGKFALDTQAGAEAYSLVKMRAIDEFSIGYIVRSSEPRVEQNKNVRALLDVDVGEISLVTFACNPESKIIDIKSAIESGDNITPKMVRKFLQEAGLSRRQAEQAIYQIKSSLEDLSNKESDVESDKKTVQEQKVQEQAQEQKTANKPVPEVKSTSDKMEQKACWWMRETLEDPILSIDCLMNVFYYLPPSTIAEMLTIAEQGRLTQLNALNEEKSDGKLDTKGDDSVDTGSETDDEEKAEEETNENDVEVKSISAAEISSWFEEDNE